MSNPRRETLTCPCGTSFSADVYRAANVTAAPELKGRILARTFNHALCPSCGREVEAEVPFLYHDMHAGQMIWVYPTARADQAEAIRARVRRSYEIVGTVLPDDPETIDRSVVFGLDELIARLGEA